MVALLRIVIAVWWSVSLSLAQECLRTPPAPDEVDCSTVVTGQCLVERENDNLEPIPDPEQNSRSCYRTCIRTVDPFISCEVNRIPFENNKLVRLEGPREMRAYGKFRIFSPNYRKPPPYNNNVFCSYHVFCADRQPESILTVNILKVFVENQTNCDDTSDVHCPDGVRLRLPYGNTCTLCGSGPLVCTEVPDGPELPQLLSFDGNSSLIIEFQANRKDRFQGFQFVATCVRRGYYTPHGCTSPERIMPGKRNVDSMESVFRGKRGTYIVVRPDSAVSYSGYTVRVFRDEERLFVFSNTRIFQVWNLAEGFQTYAESAPEGRIFPGYGLLKLGSGIIQYIQTGVAEEFLPTAAEAAIITNLQWRIVEGIDEPDIDISDDMDPTGEPGLPDDPGFTDEELALMNEQASRFDNACNGILRAAACVYQEMFFPGGSSSNCLTDVPPMP